MDRRAFLGALGLLASPRAAAAQPAGRVWRIGALMSLYAADTEPAKALRKELLALGYAEGQNLAFEWRYSRGRDDRLPSLAAELVKLPVDLLVTDTTLATQTAMKATSTIPIVVGTSADAVGGGLVSNLSRPGGNVTGISVMHADTSVKRLQLLKEAVPAVLRVAVLWDPTVPFHRRMLKEIDSAAPTLRLQAIPIAVKGRHDLGDALTEMTKARVDAVFVSQALAPAAAKALLDFTAQRRLASMFHNREYIRPGGLMSYSANVPEMFRHAAVYVDKILRGARPADLPVEQPTTFELVINLKTAKALGLTIPPSLLQRADRVIE